MEHDQRRENRIVGIFNALRDDDLWRASAGLFVDLIRRAIWEAESGEISQDEDIKAAIARDVRIAKRLVEILKNDSDKFKAEDLLDDIYCNCARETIAETKESCDRVKRLFYDIFGNYEFVKYWKDEDLARELLLQAARNTSKKGRKR